MDIKIPNLGDGIDSAIVISVLVQPGDQVAFDQAVVELETDKAVAPVPAPAAGKITTITINEGDTVSEGKSIGQLETEQGASASSAAKENVQPAPVPQVIPTAPSIPQQQVVVPTAPIKSAQPINTNPVTSISLQKLAYRIGLDLRYITGTGTGSGGRIEDQDIINHIAYLQSLMHQPTDAVTQPDLKKQKTSLPDFSKWGPIQTDKCSPLRQKIADKMVQAWQDIPHVTQQHEIDITDIMALRKKYNPKYQKKNAKLTLTVFAIRAVQKALECFPQFNSTYDYDSNTLIKKEYMNMGIAVDTPNGLIVPVIKDIAGKNLLALSTELAEIAQKAKDRSLSVEDLQGGTFTISNLGGLGVGAFTPIINTPEVAIIGIGSGEFKPVIDKKQNVTYRLKMPVCLSYDHRIIDGADGARFIMEIKNQFESFPESELKEI